MTPRPAPPKPAPLQKASWPKVLGLVAIAVLGGFGGYAFAKFGDLLLAPSLGSKTFKLVPLLALPLSWIVSVALHELGHVAGGMLGGGRLLLYIVGPFMWRRSSEGLKFSWNRQINLSGGLAACLPLNPAQVTPRRFAVMIAGGPVVSLLLGALLLLLALAFKPHVTGPWLGVLQHVLVFTGFVSLLIFLATAIPGTAGGFKSDGRRFLDLLRDDAKSEQEKALIVLTVSSLSGVRPGDYDPAILAKVTALKDGSLFDLYGHYNAFHHAMDRGEPELAQQILDHVTAGEDKLPPFIRDAVRCDYAWLLAEFAHAPAEARSWLDSAGPVSFEPATRLRAESAVLLAEGRRAEAAEKAKQGIQAVMTKSLGPVPSAFALDVFARLQAKAEAA